MCRLSSVVYKYFAQENTIQRISNLSEIYGDGLDIVGKNWHIFSVTILLNLIGYSIERHRRFEGFIV